MQRLGYIRVGPTTKLHSIYILWDLFITIIIMIFSLNCQLQILLFLSLCHVSRSAPSPLFSLSIAVTHTQLHIYVVENMIEAYIINEPQFFGTHTHELQQIWMGKWERVKREGESKCGEDSGGWKLVGLWVCCTSIRLHNNVIDCEWVSECVLFVNVGIELNRISLFHVKLYFIHYCFRCHEIS